VLSSEFQAVSCAIEDIEELGSVVEVDPGLQSAFRFADRQLANRFALSRLFGVNFQPNCLFDESSQGNAESRGSLFCLTVDLIAGQRAGCLEDGEFLPGGSRLPALLFRTGHVAPARTAPEIDPVRS
jgi:hypothetical protein